MAFNDPYQTMNLYKVKDVTMSDRNLVHIAYYAVRLVSWNGGTLSYELRTKLLVGEYAISKYGGPLSVVRVLYVPDINKAEACNLRCGMLCFAA